MPEDKCPSPNSESRAHLEIGMELTHSKSKVILIPTSKHGAMTIADYVALALFLFLWFGYSWATGGRQIFSRQSLNQAMIARRRQWIHNALRRELRMIDTQILAGLQNGTAFFASHPFSPSAAALRCWARQTAST